MASLEDRVKELEIRVGSKVKIVRSKWRPQHVGQVVEVVEKDPYFEGQWGLPMENDVWYYPEEDLELVDEARFSGKTPRQIFDEGYDEGYDEGLAAGRGEKEALIDQLTDELTESRERAAVLERLNNVQRETIRRLRSSDTQEETIRRLREQVDLHQETIRRLREQVDILQASHGSRGEVSKPAPEFKKGDLVKIVGPCVEDSSGQACHRGQVRVLTEKDETGWWKIAAFLSCRFPESSLELVERAS